MSTHPRDVTRLQALAVFLPEARKYYVPAPGGPKPAPARDLRRHPAVRLRRPAGRDVGSHPPISLVPADPRLPRPGPGLSSSDCPKILPLGHPLQRT